jgi:inorganic pyrophosphatase
VFCLAKVLPAGMSFPFDFGYVPGTLAEDGDPLDVLLMMDEPVFPGCVVFARPVGIIEAGQRDAGSRKRKRNDRLIAVATESKNQKGVRTLRDLPRPLIKQVEKFFVFYHQQEGGTFEPIGERGPKQAVAMVERAARAARKQNRRNGNGRQTDR